MTRDLSCKLIKLATTPNPSPAPPFSPSYTQKYAYSFIYTKNSEDRLKTRHEISLTVEATQGLPALSGSSEAACCRLSRMTIWQRYLAEWQDLIQCSQTSIGTSGHTYPCTTSSRRPLLEKWVHPQCRTRCLPS